MRAKHLALHNLERACRVYPDIPGRWLALSRGYVKHSAFAKAAAAHRKYELLLSRCEPFVTIEKNLSAALMRWCISNGLRITQPMT